MEATETSYFNGNTKYLTKKLPPQFVHSLIGCISVLYSFKVQYSKVFGHMKPGTEATEASYFNGGGTQYKRINTPTILT
jgi:hypothetical protein